MVEFNADWYREFVNHTDEKDVIVSRIQNLIEDRKMNFCLEIGLGLSPYFASRLSKFFNKYVIVEKRQLNGKLPSSVEIINDDWENIKLTEKFDLIIASHVFYYFKSKTTAINKMFSALSDEGRIMIVANGKGADYGKLKAAFSNISGYIHRFTYDDVLKTLRGRKFKEHTVKSAIIFSSYEELFDVLRLSFDDCPEIYEKWKVEVIDYLKRNIKGDSFTIEQKIIEVES